MIEAIVFALSISIIIGIIVSYIARKTKVNEDPLIVKISEALPQNNCGGCGYANCDDYARNVAKDSSLIGLCVVGGKETALKLSKILGVEYKAARKKRAYVLCRGGINCNETSDYQGIKSCRAAAIVTDIKECSSGCIGFGDCIEKCKFNAISMGVDGYPIIDLSRCVGCGKCAEACPKDIIKIDKANLPIVVSCSSKDQPKNKAKQCKTSCIGCGLCAKVCPKNAIKMEENLPIVDYSLCDGCGTCAEKCPRKAITKVNFSSQA